MYFNNIKTLVIGMYICVIYKLETHYLCKCNLLRGYY